MKKCPYCAEQIQDEAIVCRYCGRDLLPLKNIDVAKINKTEQSGSCLTAIFQRIVVRLLIAGVFVLILWATSSNYSTTQQKITPTQTPIPTQARIINSANGFQFGSETQTTEIDLVPGCVWALQVSQNDLSKYLCVQGLVYKITGNDTSIGTTRIYLGGKSLLGTVAPQFTSFYIVDEANYYPNLAVGDCIVVDGSIRITNDGNFFINIISGLKGCS